MKRIILPFLMALLLCSIAGCGKLKAAPAVTPVCDLYVGMPMQDIYTLYENDEIVVITNDPAVTICYYFIEDDNGNPMVLTVQSSKSKYTVTDIVAYDKDAIVVSREAFYSIAAGMTPQQVIALVGMPDGCFHSNVDRLTWEVEDNLFDVIFRSRSSEEDDFIVYDVCIRGTGEETSILDNR